MLPTAWQHIPGVDLLGRDSLRSIKVDLGEQESGTKHEQMGNTMIKAVTIARRPAGPGDVGTYGGAGWDLNFAKKNHRRWQAALGVNLLVPHLSHYSLQASATRTSALVSQAPAVLGRHGGARIPVSFTLRAVPRYIRG